MFPGTNNMIEVITIDTITNDEKSSILKRANMNAPNRDNRTKAGIR